MFKKIITLGMLFLMAFSLAACVQGDELATYKTAAKSDLNAYYNFVEKSEFLEG